jgi:hypothetical protein
MPARDDNPTPVDLRSTQPRQTDDVARSEASKASDGLATGDELESRITPKLAVNHNETLL